MSPEPIMKGRFNLFETPQGGFHISYMRDGEEEMRHLEIPPIVAKVMKGEMNPMTALRKMMSGNVS